MYLFCVGGQRAIIPMTVSFRISGRDIVRGHGLDLWEWRAFSGVAELSGSDLFEVTIVAAEGMFLQVMHTDPGL